MAAAVALAAGLIMSLGSEQAQGSQPGQDEDDAFSSPQQTVPRYREARPDEPGLRYQRVDPPRSVPQAPAPRYGQDERDGQDERYAQDEPDEDDVLRPRRPLPQGRYDSDLEPEDPAFSEPELDDAITANDALRIARSKGMVRAGRVREGRRGFVVTGRDIDGFAMRIVIDRDGFVVDLRRE